MLPDQEDMPMHEATGRLLWQFQRCEAITINEVACCINGLVAWLRLERDVLAAHEVDLQRIQLLPKEIAKDCLLASDRNLQPMQRQQLELVERPSKLTPKSLMLNRKEHLQTAYPAGRVRLKDRA